MVRYILVGTISLAIGVLLGIVAADWANRKQLRAAREQVATLTEALESDFKGLQDEAEKSVSVLPIGTPADAVEKASAPVVAADVRRDKTEVDHDRMMEMRGREWKSLSDDDRRSVVEHLAMLIVLMDSNVKADPSLPLDAFLDEFYADAGNEKTKIYDAADVFLERSRGVLLRDEGSGNKATDPFICDGVHYLLFVPKKPGVYSVSVYDDRTAEIADANIITNFGDSAEASFTRLRLPRGVYYFEVNSTVPWSMCLLSQRGIEWLKRGMNSEAAQKAGGR